jgi:ABC-2 type transport system permease protein
VTRALAWLILVSARNQLRVKARQLRNPRYAIALLLGLGYFWLVFFNRSAREGRQPSLLVSDTFAALFPVGVLAYVAFTWIIGADRNALAFSQAEVFMLFTAPVSRRTLVVYKLVRAQGPVLFTSILWFVLFHRPGVGFSRVISSWVFLTTFSLHRFVIAEFAKAPLSWVLYPFRVATTPMFATSTSAWVAAIVPALVLLALHAVWVIRGDTAFEEAAVEASAARAARRQALRTRGATGGMVNPKSSRRTIRLAPLGAPEVALVWKNVLWLIRTGQARAILGLPAIAAVCALAFAGRSTTAEVLVAVLCGVVVLVTVVFGPMTMRNDLRSELRRLPMLKTLPLTGREIIAAEVASSALPTALMQFLMTAVGLLALSLVPDPPLSRELRVGLLLGSPVLLAGLSFANFTIHNAMALLFPAWVRLGAAGEAGVEAMGQVMLTSIVTLFLLAILLVLPVVAAAAVWFVMRWPPLFASAGAGMAAGVVCALEAYLLIGALGGALERLEPMQVG